LKRKRDPTFEKRESVGIRERNGRKKEQDQVGEEGVVP